jgi:hypothetical protein
MSAASSSVMNLTPDVAGVQLMRPGLVTYATTGLGTAPLIGLHRYRTFMIGVDSDRKIYALPDGAPTAWTALSDATAATKLDGSLRPTFAEDASDLFIAGGGAIQKWTGAGLTARLGGTSPTDCSHIVNIGQRLVGTTAANPTRYLYSDLGDGNDSTWGALSFITTEARPDPIVAIYENTAELFLFGKTTTEVHGISSDALVPFERITTLNLGSLAPYSQIRSDNVFSWLDNQRRFITSDGRSYEWLSEAIQKDLLGLSAVEDCFGFREDTTRGTMLVWVFPSAARTFAYNLSSKKWGERDYYSAGLHVAWPVRCHAYWDALNLQVVGAANSPGLYSLDPSVATDLGGTMVGEIVTGHQNFGTENRKRSSKVVVTMRRGEAVADSQIELAVADDGRGWSGFKTRTLGIPGDYRDYVEFHFGGVFKRRRYWLRYSGANPVAIASLHDDVIDLEAQG